MLHWQGMKNFVKLITIKFTDFYLIKMNLVQILLWTPKYW